MKRRNKNALQKTIFTIHNNNGEFYSQIEQKLSFVFLMFLIEYAKLK